MQHRPVIWTSLLTAFVLGFFGSRAPAAEPVWPGMAWATKTPDEVGLDADKLEAFSRFVGGRGCVVRHGYMVYSWGDVSRQADVASACKPWFSHFLFKAIEEGKIDSLDEKVIKWEPWLRRINKQLGYKDREITWRHLANQTSCYQLAESPGTAFAYNDWQMALFWDTLFLKVYGATYESVDEKVLHPLLTNPLQCEDNPTFMAFGTGNRPGRLGVSARDFARFGLLYLRKGNWKGEQLISSKHAKMAVASPLPNSIPRAGREAADVIPGQRTMGSRSKPDNQTDHFGSYSWLWWINGVDRNGTRMWPDAPEDTLGAFGHGGPRAMWVIPSRDIVVSYNDAKLRGWASGRKSPTNQAMKLLVEACVAKPGKVGRKGLFFPPPGESLAIQDQRRPGEVGLHPEVVDRIRSRTNSGLWALWRHGYLVHLEGEFNKKTEVKSLRKTWHALTVGAVIKQGKIPSYHQKINVWNRDLTGKHAEATWWHLVTQSSGFDYPYADFPAYKPGEIWTYSDKNPRHLCNALARAYGKKDYYDNYSDVVRGAYFDAIGMLGWDTSARGDGVRFHFDLEDMGRLGLLVLARGRWNGVELIPKWFVEELETKQTRGMLVNYNGPDDGRVNLDPREFPEAPYSFMTWVNTDGDYYPGADRSWAWGAGAGGTYILWNHKNGVVFAGVGVDTSPTSNGIPQTIETHIDGPNPLVDVLEGSHTTAFGTSQRPGKSRGNIGRFPKWARIEIPLSGPDSQGRGNPNPFSIWVDATFMAPSGKRYQVPGFYDGNGGGLDGSVWKVRFSADETGTWQFETSSANSQLDGHVGSFTVTTPPSDAPDFYRWGRLQSSRAGADRTRYLKFRDGPYWLKAGCDDPENFLGNFRNYNTLAKRKSAIDYLAARGINSLYIMTHNIDGDHRDVWPWLGESGREAKDNGGADARFDVAKLEQWRELFEYMQAKGVVPYLVLEDDSAWTGYNHARYYREMVARFGYLPALMFNLGEEYNENYRLAAALSLIKQLEDIDPYDHPRGIHNVNKPNDEYADASQVDFASIQTSGSDPLVHNQLAIDWINRCKSRNRRILMVGFDEGRPEQDRKGWWAAYLGGGVWEVHVKEPYDRPMPAWEPAWTELGGARTFMESLPFWETEPNNDLVKSGTAFCLAEPGEVYALYLPSGGRVTVELKPGVTYEYAWWKATNGKSGLFQNRGRVRGGRQQFTAPGEGDWALRIVRTRQ